MGSSQILCPTLIRLLMPPPHLTLAKPKSWFQEKHGLHTIDISSAEPSWQMMWHGLKVEVLSPKHRPPTLPLVPGHEARM